MVGEVRSIEAGDDNARIAKPELESYVIAHTRRRGRGESNRWRSAELGADVFDPEIARTEIVTPLTNAMSFVDREQAYADAAKSFSDVPVIESLGGEVKQLELASCCARKLSYRSEP